MKPESTQVDGHLTEGDIAAYIDAAMSVDERRIAEAHLALCDSCRAEVIASSDAVSDAPAAPARSRKSLRWVGVAVAAAAAVVVASTLTRNAADRDALRDGNTNGIGARLAVTVVSPVDGTQLARDGRLVWRSFGDGASYRLTIGDENAQPIYSATVQDTVAALPSSIPQTAGRKLFWYVDAIGPDGVTATSGLKSFTIE